MADPVDTPAPAGSESVDPYGPNRHSFRLGVSDDPQAADEFNNDGEKIAAEFSQAKEFADVDVEDKAPVKKSVASTSAAGPSPFMSSNSAIGALLAFCGVITIATFATALSLSFKNADRNAGSSGDVAEAQKSRNIVINTADMEYLAGKPPQGENPCEGKKPDLPNVDCIVNAMVNVGPQAGANVTKGYRGELSVDHLPIDTPYWQNGLCPVNVHWHLGAEHYSAGQYDETGSGPENPSSLLDLDRRLEEQSERKLQRVRGGYQCKFYNDADETFNTPYVWEHCVGMEVGETYEVHWPHSAAGACGTPNQYQTPFYDGVFCRDGVLTDTAKQIGVQAQVFTIVNDEAYYYPDLMRGMIVDGAMGQDIAMYTGSTTGTTRDNEICSQFSPITWQVDRKCHLISASSFDKMCMEMKAQRDDMSGDLYAHGSRELVADELTADNQANRALSGRV